MHWANSDRASRLPADWAARKRATRLRAHGRCEAHHHHPDCDGRGTECDHIHTGDDHSLTNLQWLSKPCHRAKTTEETRARNRLDAALRRRPAEPHPGALR